LAAGTAGAFGAALVLTSRGFIGSIAAGAATAGALLLVLAFTDGWPLASAAVVVRRRRDAPAGGTAATGSFMGIDVGVSAGGAASSGVVGGLRRAMFRADSLGPTPVSVAAGT
jgi:hypothetical protein